MPAKRPISPHLSPNARPQDVKRALYWLINPYRWFMWRKGRALSELDDLFKRKFSVSFARSFSSGRIALYALLDALDLQEGDEVAMQSFTCVVVPNAIIAANGKPVYVDIDNTYNLDPVDLEKKLDQSKKIRAVIVQHTFGQPAQIERIQEICTSHGVTLIEDCAHSLGATVNGMLVGTFGQAAMFSFGRDKVISAVSGGMAITNDAEIAQHLNNYWLGLRFPSHIWIKQRLLHPLLFALGIRFYYVGSLGKIIIAVSKKIRLFPLVLFAAEKKEAKQQKGYRLPNAMAAAAVAQMSVLEEMQEHRQRLADLYASKLNDAPGIQLPVFQPNAKSALLRYTIQVKRRNELVAFAKQRGILLGDWYDPVIAPPGSNMEAVHYAKGSCSVAEAAARTVVNLPTNIQTTEQDAHDVIETIKEFYQ
ncbi:MAG: aminotransferase class I/II-fold pyridoxal phosphate-dependent enzyme [Candidatus Kerfeldbacteria bacterium]